ncbi:ABC transporter ATP-binding protein [Arthrobacter mangrovi]|uniref:ABC transporter n=1 Tax=Arthrobacter mangrovi TaxID=2966350 RepID=A0ABQ5MZX6_9MICC|nr:ABC transporter ATP-binding protein [Arthrobacter mangrovi]GLB69494.1 ABC transporter [Arthrobacter mangrovi]
MLKVTNMTKTYGQGSKAVQAIGGLDFEVGEGRFVSIVGPSGAGKTTLLKCLCGLLKPTSGSVAVDGVPVDGPPESMALVFQDYRASLMPWFTIERNVGLPLEGRVHSSEIRKRVDEALEAVGLGHCHKQYPWQLSGGMQQRVAIARAVAYRPAILLMDEPFASVDAQTRADLEDLTLSIQRNSGATVLFVTHDVDEAVYLSDQVIVMSSAPSTVRQIVNIDLPRDRDQVTTKSEPQFAGHRRDILTMIRRPSPVQPRQ